MNLPYRLRIAALAVSCFAFLSVAAKADHVFNLNETLASGATFSGTVTLADDYLSITGVNGTLTGYNNSTLGYVGGSDTDTFNHLYCGYNCTYGSSGTYADWFLDDGTNYGSYTNFLMFTYDYTNAPNVTFAGVGSYSNDGYPLNGAGTGNYADIMVSGTLTPVAATPEPSTISMMLLATGTLGQFAARRRMRRS